MFSALFVLSVLEAPNTKTNSLCVCKLPCVCANTLGNKAISESDSDDERLWCSTNQSVFNDYLVACKQSL